MKTVLGTVAAAFSMFSALPVPQAPWDERHMRWMLAAFPLIGLVSKACQGRGREKSG